MSYSLSVPNVKKGTDAIELTDRVLATADAVGYSEEALGGDPAGLRNRLRESALIAIEMIEKMELGGEGFNLSFSGHVNLGEDDPTGDYAAVMVTSINMALLGDSNKAEVLS